MSVGRPQGSRSVVTPSPGHHGRNGPGRGWGGSYADRLLIKWSGPVWSLKEAALSYSKSGADWQMMHGSLGATRFPVSRCPTIELFTHYQWPYYQVKCEGVYSRILTSKSSFFFPSHICVSILNKLFFFKDESGLDCKGSFYPESPTTCFLGNLTLVFAENVECVTFIANIIWLGSFAASSCPPQTMSAILIC